MGSISRTGEYNGRNLTAYRLDASIDGVRWDVGIAQDDALEPPETAGRWYSEPTKSNFGKRPNKGFVIDSPTPTVLCTITIAQMDDWSDRPLCCH